MNAGASLKIGKESFGSGHPQGLSSTIQRNPQDHCDSDNT